MQIQKLAGDGRIVSRARALHPNAAPHAWETAEGVRLSAPTESDGVRHGDTIEVWLDARAGRHRRGPGKALRRRGRDPRGRRPLPRRVRGRHRREPRPPRDRDDANRGRPGGRVPRARVRRDRPEAHRPRRRRRTPPKNLTARPGRARSTTLCNASTATTPAAGSRPPSRSPTPGPATASTSASARSTRRPGRRSPTGNPTARRRPRCTRRQPRPSSTPTPTCRRTRCSRSTPTPCGSSAKSPTCAAKTRAAPRRRPWAAYHAEVFPPGAMRPARRRR